jgi:3-isopropylmalate/(R)-2-methylmalate dehydratase large subunit
MGQTFAEKIMAGKAGLPKTVPGQIVEITPDVALSHDNTAAIWDSFKKMDGVKVFDPKMHVIVLDHAVPAPSTGHAENHRNTRQFVTEQGIECFYDVGRGICHQVLVEEGLALPGEVVLGADSHTTTAGALGAFGVGIGRSEMAAVWAIGELWLRVPESLKIIVHGKLSPHVSAKDVSLFVIGKLGTDGGLYMSVEWHGDAIAAFDVGERMVIANMTAEMGAKNCYMLPDQKIFDYLQNRAKRSYEPVYPDTDARYAQIVEFDGATIDPMIACPHSVDNVKPLSEVAGLHVDQAFIGTCTNARIEDLSAAAAILRGKRVAAGTRLIVIPASSQVYMAALKAGYIETFLQAGAVIQGPGCGPCLGMHLGIPAVGEVVISSANRNFQGRMGTSESDVYLASPAVVAAAAVAGSITHPKQFLDGGK